MIERSYCCTSAHHRRKHDPEDANPLTPLQKISKEILDHPVLDPETNPLVWWEAENARFPKLANLASRYLCICGTGVPSETT